MERQDRHPKRHLRQRRDRSDPRHQRQHRLRPFGRERRPAVIAICAIVGPLIVNGVLDHYKAAGLNRMDGYRVVLHTMVCLLVVGFIANLLVRPVAQRFWLKDTPTPQTIGAAH